MESVCESCNLNNNEVLNGVGKVSAYEAVISALLVGASGCVVEAVGAVEVVAGGVVREASISV